jgi:hypothetical protein
MIIKLIIIGKIISINIIDFYLKIYYHNKMNQNIKETYYGKKIDTSNILNIEDASKTYQ